MPPADEQPPAPENPAPPQPAPSPPEKPEEAAESTNLLPEAVPEKPKASPAERKLTAHEKRLKALEESAKQSEPLKAWENSYARRAVIALAVFAFSWFTVESQSGGNPLATAMIPVVGYVLVVLGLPLIRDFWLKKFYMKSSQE